MKKYYIFFLCITVLSCSQQEPLLDTALDNQILHWGNGSEPQSLDPHIATGVPEHHVLIALCEGLTITNPKGGDNLPGVAQAWDISDDGLIYTFFLSFCFSFFLSHVLSFFPWCFLSEPNLA